MRVRSGYSRRARITPADPLKPVKNGVVIGYLSGGDTRIEFTRSIGAVTAHSIGNNLPLVGALPHVSGPRIAAGRNHLVESFLASPGEWLLMVDDDMSFDGDVIDRFLKVADAEKRPIVGGLAFATGRDGIFPTLFQVHPEAQVPVRITAWPLDDLVEVDATGAACLFVHRSVFERMSDEYPKPWQWFQETQLNGSTVGEDMTFCLRARALGFPIVVDTSIKFGHVKARIIDEDEFFRWMDTHRFVITGTGRCGTSYMSTVMQACRIITGHEQKYTADGYKPNPFIRGDASWLAVPYLDRFTGYVLHLVRHPLDVINSYTGIGFFDDGDQHGGWSEFSRTHAPDVWEHDTPVERAMAWYVTWNRRIEEYAHKRLQVEQVTGEELVDLVRYAGAHHAPWEIQKYVDQVPTHTNSRERAELTWEDLPAGELKAELEQMAKDYGYDL